MADLFPVIRVSSYCCYWRVLQLFHPMDQSVWASRGPEGESLGAVVQPLPTSHLIFRAPTNAAGKCWMDALELALRCSSLLIGRKQNRNSAVGFSLILQCFYW